MTLDNYFTLPGLRFHLESEGLDLGPSLRYLLTNSEGSCHPQAWRSFALSATIDLCNFSSHEANSQTLPPLKLLDPYTLYCSPRNQDWSFCSDLGSDTPESVSTSSHFKTNSRVIALARVQGHISCAFAPSSNICLSYVQSWRINIPLFFFFLPSSDSSQLSLQAPLKTFHMPFLTFILFSINRKEVFRGPCKKPSRRSLMWGEGMQWAKARRAVLFWQHSLP